MERIETLGSVWLIDDDAKRYCRFPKTEAGRELPEWGDESAGPLQDAVWHDFTAWRIIPGRFYPDLMLISPDRLRIDIDDNGHHVSAPLNRAM